MDMESSAIQESLKGGYSNINDLCAQELHRRLVEASGLKAFLVSASVVNKKENKRLPVNWTVLATSKDQAVDKFRKYIRERQGLEFAQQGELVHVKIKDMQVIH